MIKIYSFVDSFKHFEPAIKEFEKRLGKSVVFVKLKPSKRKTSQEVVAEETAELEKILTQEKGYKVMMSIQGKTMTSPSFQLFLEEKQMYFGDVIFIIGGAYGADEQKLSDLIDYKLSFSPMTFPHAQAIMMLFEQLYRAESIKVGRNYHH